MDLCVCVCTCLCACACAWLARRYTHEAVMTGLKPVTKYFYKVGSDQGGWSDVFYYTSQVC